MLRVDTHHISITNRKHCEFLNSVFVKLVVFIFNNPKETDKVITA